MAQKDGNGWVLVWDRGDRCHLNMPFLCKNSISFSACYSRITVMSDYFYKGHTWKFQWKSMNDWIDPCANTLT